MVFRVYGNKHKIYSLSASITLTISAYEHVDIVLASDEPGSRLSMYCGRNRMNIGSMVSLVNKRDSTSLSDDDSETECSRRIAR